MIVMLKFTHYISKTKFSSVPRSYKLKASFVIMQFK